MADPSTLSNCLEVAVTSWHLCLDADFATKKLSGAVTLRGRVLADNLNRIVSAGGQSLSLLSSLCVLQVLDTRDLTVSSAAIEGTGEALAFHFDKEHTALGTALVIQAPSCWKK